MSLWTELQAILPAVGMWLESDWPANPQIAQTPASRSVADEENLESLDLTYAEELGQKKNLCGQ